MTRRAHRRRAVVASIAALVLVPAGLLACTSDDETSVTPTTGAPSEGDGAPVEVTQTIPRVATTKAPTGVGQPFTVWFLRDGRLSPGEARVATTDDTAREALEALIAGRTPLEEDLGLQTGVRADVEVLSFELQGTTALVGFNRALETTDTRPQVAQIVWTLTQLPGIDAVQFLIDGRPNGATGVPPMDRFEVDEMAPPVLVDQPLPGTVAGDVTELVVEGTTAPGAEVGWRLEDAFGGVLAEGGADDVAPAPGPDTRTAWRSTVPVPAGIVGTVRLVVADTSSGVEANPQVVPVTVGPAPPAAP